MFFKLSLTLSHSLIYIYIYIYIYSTKNAPQTHKLFEGVSFLNEADTNWLGDAGVPHTVPAQKVK